MKKKYSAGILFAIFSVKILAGELYIDFPKNIKPSQKYVFYSHGYIVEGDNSKPVHPRWGIYDFPKVKEELSDDSYNLIAYHRSEKTNPFDFGKKLANDVNKLIEAGVKPENITLVGFSRGGAISILASHELKNTEINIAILAGCAGLVKSNPGIQLYGRVLSIYETSDQVGSCEFLKDRSQKIKSFKEFSISTGKEHGAFYLPRQEWVAPLKQWLKSNPG